MKCPLIHVRCTQVAWVHLDRQMILTIHRQVVTRVGRFSVSYDHQRTWQLHIRGVHAEDAGTYMLFHLIPLLQLLRLYQRFDLGVK